MNTKPTCKRNSDGVKSSTDMYRNIKGVHYAHHASNPADFEEAIQDAKKDNLKIKIIKGELFIEKKIKKLKTIKKICKSQ